MGITNTISRAELAGIANLADGAVNPYPHIMKPKDVYYNAIFLRNRN
jgi:hypothetical protein